MACLAGRCQRRGRYFLFPNQQLNFQNAARFCESHGYQLLTHFDRITTASLFNCCDPRNLREQFWIGLKRNREQCSSEQWPYQWLGDRGCVSSDPSLLISQKSNNSCVGVALTRMRRNDRAIRAREFPCQNGFRFICYSGQRPTIPTTTTQFTTSLKTKVTTGKKESFDTTGNSIPVTNTEISESSVNSSSATENLLVRGAVGGASTFLILLVLIAVIHYFLCKKGQDSKNVREMAKRKQNVEPFYNSYYGFDPHEEQKDGETRSGSCINTISLPASVPVNSIEAHYVLPDTSPPPKEETTGYHEYIEIDHYSTIDAAANDHVYACMTGISQSANNINSNNRNYESIHDDDNYVYPTANNCTKI